MQSSKIFALVLVMLVTRCRGQMRVDSNDGKSLNGFCAKGLRHVESQGCVDIDECKELAPCKIGQTCRNLWGSYLCNCHRGYVLDKTTGDCMDVDECAMGFCGSGQRCINTVGSFRCICSAGMVKRGKFCRDVNECTQRPCDDNQYCLNTKGSYQCRCRSGYVSNRDGTCSDDDECTRAMCQGMGEECRNTIGSYECVCSRGYTKDALTNGRYCTDVNECDLSPCPDNSECVNTQGSFICRCHRGFTKHRGLCVDNKECSLGEGDKCQWKCENLPGSFRCACPPGYDQVDYSCIDINECDNGEGKCRHNEICVNTHGSFKCIKPLDCPHEGGLFRKLTRTDEFGYRQVTTNICRRRRCKKITNTNAMYNTCKQQPLSVSYHFVSITSGLTVPTKIFRVKFPARRRRQQYNFSIVQGDTTMFSLLQMSLYRPHAYLMLNKQVNGQNQFKLKVDMSTYNRRGQMRDNRMLTITVFISQYDF